MRRPARSSLACVVLAAIGCTGKPDAPTPVPAVPATPVVPTTPVVPATPAAAIPPPPPGSCDVTGTWRLKLVFWDSACVAAEDVLLELAVAPGPAGTVAGKLQAVGAVGALAPLLSTARITPYGAPGTTCGLRLELGARPGTHAELLLGREREGLAGIDGLASLWVTGATPCQDHASVFGEYIATEPAPWSGLTRAGPWPSLPAARRASPDVEIVGAEELGQLDADELHAAAIGPVRRLHGRLQRVDTLHAAHKGFDLAVSGRAEKLLGKTEHGCLRGPGTLRGRAAGNPGKSARLSARET